jgi:hypothetical protein
MHMLNRRLQILVDEERFERLSGESARTGAPVGELVRRAIDREYPRSNRQTQREQAGRELLAMAPPPGPERDWEEQKREMLDAPTHGATGG